MRKQPPKRNRTIFVGRHHGAHEWIEKQSITIDEWVTHIDPTTIQPGDIIIGTLPVQHAASICTRGARYLHLVLDLPENLRGTELEAKEMNHYGARLEEFLVLPVSTPLTSL
ncbi:CRISPR-associated protein Csx16 [Thiolapillus sp.]